MKNHNSKCQKFRWVATYVVTLPTGKGKDAKNSWECQKFGEFMIFSQL